MAPSPPVLQFLITVCYEENEIMLNTQKTLCMAVLLKCMKDHNVPTMFLNNRELRWVAEQKYIDIFYQQ